MHQYQFFKDNPTKKFVVLENINYNMAEKEKYPSRATACHNFLIFFARASRLTNLYPAV